MVNVAIATHAALTAPPVSRPLAYLAAAPPATSPATGGGFQAHRSRHSTVPAAAAAGPLRASAVPATAAPRVAAAAFGHHAGTTPLHTFAAAPAQQVHGYWPAAAMMPTLVGGAAFYAHPHASAFAANAATTPALMPQLMPHHQPSHPSSSFAAASAAASLYYPSAVVPPPTFYWQPVPQHRADNTASGTRPTLPAPAVLEGAQYDEVLRALRCRDFAVAANDILVPLGKDGRWARCAEAAFAVKTVPRVDADAEDAFAPLPTKYVGDQPAVRVSVGGVPSTMTAHELRRCLLDLCGVSLLAMHPASETSVAPPSSASAFVPPHVSSTSLVFGSGATVRWTVTVPSMHLSSLMTLHRRVLVQSEQATLFSSAEAADNWTALRDSCLMSVRQSAGMSSDFRAASNALSVEAVPSAQ